MTDAPSRRKLGASGEEAAAQWYADRGYELVARNWRCRDGEIDLIMRGKHLFVFCEVKTRSSRAFGAPVEAVNGPKQARLRRLAARWLAEAAPVHPRGIRFDVVSILDGEIEVLEWAF